MNQPSEQKLDEMLRRGFPGAVADEGFSARVMRALPARRRPRPWLLPAAMLAGVLLTWLTLLPSPLLQQAAREWAAGGLGATSVAVYALLLGVMWLGCSWALEEAG